ncbi:cupin domain-containing protein [Candidatus Bathyarchaeota archaeon]|nr:cupin domain-containing protein [Candidatus Bathyarchaeota archaeon]
MFEEPAGEAHGAHPIPLVYWNGLRSSWYLVKAGETLKREGETDPWPQMFIVLKGRVKVHEEEFEIEPKMAIHIPKDCTHQIAAEEDVELIWISW